MRQGACSSEHFEDDGHGDLAWLRIELDLLASTRPLAARERVRLADLVRREREILGLDAPRAP